MSTSKSCEVNRHTAWGTNPECVVSQYKLVSGWELQKHRSALPYGSMWLRKDFTFLSDTKLWVISYTIATRKLRWITSTTTFWYWLHRRDSAVCTAICNVCYRRNTHVKEAELSDGCYQTWMKIHDKTYNQDNFDIPYIMNAFNMLSSSTVLVKCKNVQLNAATEKKQHAHQMTVAVNKNAFQLKADCPQMCIFTRAHISFLFMWPWPWPITLIYKPDLDILKVYLHTKNEVYRSRLLKVRAQTGQTHIHTDTPTYMDTQANTTEHITSHCSK